MYQLNRFSSRPLPGLHRRHILPPQPPSSIYGTLRLPGFRPKQMRICRGASINWPKTRLKMALTSKT